MGSVLLVHPPLAQDPARFARVAKRHFQADGCARADLLRVRVTRVLQDQRATQRFTAEELAQAVEDGLLPVGELPRWLEVVPA